MIFCSINQIAFFMQKTFKPSVYIQCVVAEKAALKGGGRVMDSQNQRNKETERKLEEKGRGRSRVQLLSFSLLHCFLQIILREGIHLVFRLMNLHPNLSGKAL